MTNIEQLFKFMPKTFSGSIFFLTNYALTSFKRKKKGRDRSRPCSFLPDYGKNQLFLCVARRVQVSTTVSGFSEMLLIP